MLSDEKTTPPPRCLWPTYLLHGNSYLIGSDGIAANPDGQPMASGRWLLLITTIVLSSLPNLANFLQSLIGINIGIDINIDIDIGIGICVNISIQFQHQYQYQH